MLHAIIKINKKFLIFLIGWFLNKDIVELLWDITSYFIFKFYIFNPNPFTVKIQFFLVEVGHRSDYQGKFSRRPITDRPLRHGIITVV